MSERAWYDQGDKPPAAVPAAPDPARLILGALDQIREDLRDRSRLGLVFDGFHLRMMEWCCACGWVFMYCPQNEQEIIYKPWEGILQSHRAVCQQEFERGRFR